MQLLLKRDVDSLGVVGDIVEVTNGYARNYLVPQDIAVLPTPSNVKALEEAKRVAAEKRLKKRKALEAEAERTRNVEVTIASAANEEGHLYGSVGAREIAAALRDEGFAVETSMILLSETFKQIDNRIVIVRFAPELEIDIKVWVVREKASEDLDGNESADGDDVPEDSDSHEDDE